MHKFDYDYIKHKHDKKSKLLFRGTDSLMYEIKTEDVFEDFSSDKEIFDFSNHLTESKYYGSSNKWAIREIKDETGSIEFEEFVGLKPKIYSFLVENSKHKKAKSVNKNAVSTIIHNEYKDVLLNNKCLRHSRNRIQSKEHTVGTFEINKISLPCFDD